VVGEWLGTFKNIVIRMLNNEKRAWFTDFTSDPLLKRLRESDFWHRQSAESLCRTSIDLVLFDRLSAHQETLAARQLSLKGERSIVARCLEPQRVVSGDADYVLGYDFMHPHATKSQFESSMIVVEAKKNITFAAGIAQAAIYMGISSGPFLCKF
jgi:hypothetical protein